MPNLQDRKIQIPNVQIGPKYFQNVLREKPWQGMGFETAAFREIPRRLLNLLLHRGWYWVVPACMPSK